MASRDYAADDLQTYTTANVSTSRITMAEINRLVEELERLSHYRNSIEPFPITFSQSSSQDLEKLPMTTLAISAYGQYSVMEVKLFLMQCSHTERGLVENILRNPNDADLRNAYSDYLEENGRILEAESERKEAERIKNPPNHIGISSGSINPEYLRRHGVYSNPYGYPIPISGGW